MEVKQPDRLTGWELSEKLGVTKEVCVTEFDRENNILSVTFDKHKLQVPRVMGAVMEQAEVSDIQIQETELAEIVKAIYQHGLGTDTVQSTDTDC